jgi:hypothetical protein
MLRKPASGKLALLACFFLLVAACLPMLAVAASTNDNITVVGSYRLPNFELPRVEDNSATAGGATVHASLSWGEMPFGPDGLPRHNDDRTFYPGDAFALKIISEHTLNDEAYAVEVRSSALGANDRFEVGKSYNETRPYEILDSATPGLYRVEVSMVPRKAIVEGFPRWPNEQWVEGGGKTILKDEWETGTIAETEFASNFHWELDPGHYTIVFDPENEEASPKVTETITLVAGKDYCLRGIKEWYDTGGCAGDPSYNPSYLPPPALYTGVNVCVVQYAPRFATASYLWSTYSEAGATPANSNETPLVTLVRYDGNNYDPENEEHLSLDQRAVVNTIRWSGYAEKLKTIEARKPQTTDDYSETPSHVRIMTQAYYEYRDADGNLWNTTEFISAPIYIDNVQIGDTDAETNLPPGVYDIRVENWYGAVTFRRGSLGDMYVSARQWYAPSEISIALLGGGKDYTVRVFLIENGVSGPGYNWLYDVPQVGTPENPPRQPYYRYYENGEVVYYEPGEVEVWDNGTPKVLYRDLGSVFYWTGYCSYYNQLPGPQFKEIKFFDNNTLVSTSVSHYDSQLATYHFARVNNYSAADQVERVLKDNEAHTFCTISSLFPYTNHINSAFFDASRRYGRFVMIPDHDGMAQLLNDNYISANFDLNFVWYPANGDLGWSNLTLDDDALNRAKKVFSADFTYAPVGNFQPVRAAAWKLTDEARASVYENDNYEALFDDNSWAVDENVEFKAEFIPMVVIKETLENMRENEAYRERVRQEYPELASLDEWFVDQIIKDTGADNEPVQVLEGTGEGGFTLERHNCELFYLTARAWRPGENSVENVDDLINVPFSEDEDLWIHINLSGDGMYARVSEQTGEYFKINVLSPQRAGEISSITVKDNEGHTVYLWRSYPSFAMTTFVLGVSEGEMFATPPEEIKLAKVPGMSTRFYVELTNAWGASRTVAIGVSPYKSEFEAMFDTFLFVLFGVLVGAIFFSAGARWFRMSHRAWTPYG